MISLSISINLYIWTSSNTSTFETIKIVVPVSFIASINLLIFNQFTFRRLFVVTPNSLPTIPIWFNSLSSNKESGKSLSIPDLVSYILTAPYISLINLGV